MTNANTPCPENPNAHENADTPDTADALDGDAEEWETEVELAEVGEECETYLTDAEDEPRQTNANLTDRGTMYLIEQRVENLREAIGLSLDELFELRELERTIKLHEEDKAAVPEGLGVPSKEQQFIAALEAKRTERYSDAQYDGGDIDEADEMSESSVNQYYQKLLQDSRLNLKSIALLSPDKKPIWYATNGKTKSLTLFDLYQKLPPKQTFPQFLASQWQVSESQATAALPKISEAKQYELKQRWLQYLETRTLNSPSPLQQVLFRCKNFVTSPIYDDMEETGDEHYRLANGAEFRFTDKTSVFTIPMAQLEDIPRKQAMPVPLQDIGFITVAFILPEYAHERKRYFKKNGTVAELVKYLSRLGVELVEKQTQFLNDLAADGVLRLYHEVLELPDRNEIRAYFLNVRKNFREWNKRLIEKCLCDRLQQEPLLITRQVTQLSTWFPEWMRKIGGIIVEAKLGEAVSIPKPLQIGVDTKLPAYAVKHEPLLVPSTRLMSESVPADQWQALFVAEMRTAYKTNPAKFKKYAQDLERKKIELRCGCDNHGSPHQEKCPVPVLEEIFQKIREDGKKTAKPTTSEKPATSQSV